MNFMKLQEMAENSPTLPPEMMLELIFHSIVVGVILMVVNAYAQWIIGDRYEAESTDPESTDAAIAASRSVNHSPAGQLILTSANVLFLSMGMCGIMLLVSNNLARAFAIGAAISLIRFRVKISKNSLAMSLFFGVLVGMATGVQQVRVAYGIAVIFSAIQLFLVFFALTADRMAAAVKSRKGKA